MLSLLAPVVLSLALTPPSAVWPLQPTPEVAEHFRAPQHTWGPGHRGADLLGWVGQPVHSPMDGIVTFAGRIAGRGVVVVSHGSRRTTYEPVHPAVDPGDAVVAGQVIGELEWAGSHCAPRACLHWGLVDGLEGYRDPLSLIACEPRPVRLLPLEGTTPERDASCAQPIPTWGQQLASVLLRLAGALAGTPGAAGRS